VKLEGTIHCEGPECDVHQHVGPDTMEAERLPVGWLRVTEYGGSNDREYAFCGSDCVMKWAAGFEPPIVIPAGPEPA
jgi:hypothetical protein